MSSLLVAIQPNATINRKCSQIPYIIYPKVRKNLSRKVLVYNNSAVSLVVDE